MNSPKCSPFKSSPPDTSSPTTSTYNGRVSPVRASCPKPFDDDDCDSPLIKRKNPQSRYYTQPKSVVRKPLVSRIFSTESWMSKAPRRVSFLPENCPASHSANVTSGTGCESANSTLTNLSSQFYDESLNQSFLAQCFYIDAVIGQGSFGTVYRVKSKDDLRLYAVKKSKEVFRDRSDRKRKTEEVKKLERLPSHENIVHFVKAWEERGTLYIQTELCHQTLCITPNLPEREVWHYLVDLLRGLKHIHDNNLMHLDIKPDNIFVVKWGPIVQLKLGDFGLATEVDTDYDVPDGDKVYMAPELLQPENLGRPGPPADIFSLGLTILEIACGEKLPESGDDYVELREFDDRVNQNMPLPESMPIKAKYDNLSESLKQIIRSMIRRQPKLRPNADCLLSSKTMRRTLTRRTMLLSNAKLAEIVKLWRIFSWSCVVFSLPLSEICAKYRNQLRLERARRSAGRKLAPSTLDHNGNGPLTGDQAGSYNRIKRKNVVTPYVSNNAKRKMTIDVDISPDFIGNFAKNAATSDCSFVPRLSSPSSCIGRLSFSEEELHGTVDPDLIHELSVLSKVDSSKSSPEFLHEQQILLATFSKNKACDDDKDNSHCSFDDSRRRKIRQEIRRKILKGFDYDENLATKIVQNTSSEFQNMKSSSFHCWNSTPRELKPTRLFKKDDEDEDDDDEDDDEETSERKCCQQGESSDSNSALVVAVAAATVGSSSNINKEKSEQQQQQRQSTITDRPDDQDEDQQAPVPNALQGIRLLKIKNFTPRNLLKEFYDDMDGSF